MQQPNTHRGFTLVEMMIVVAILGILALIAYPNYQNYVIKTQRTDMMGELQNIAATIESKKIALGRYQDLTFTTVNNNRTTYPYTGKAQYDLSIDDLETGEWVLTAEPIAGTRMADDGVLSIDHTGKKCHKNSCGFNDEWR